MQNLITEIDKLIERYLFYGNFKDRGRLVTYDLEIRLLKRKFKI